MKKYIVYAFAFLTLPSAHADFGRDVSGVSRYDSDESYQLYNPEYGNYNDTGESYYNDRYNSNRYYYERDNHPYEDESYAHQRVRNESVTSSEDQMHTEALRYQKAQDEHAIAEAERTVGEAQERSEEANKRVGVEHEQPEPQEAIEFTGETTNIEKNQYY